MKQKRIAFIFILAAFLLRPAFAAPEKKEVFDPIKIVQEFFQSKSDKAKKAMDKKARQTQSVDGLLLEGIARGERGGGDVAIINGDAYRAGDEVDGKKILDIQPTYIEFENLKTHEKKKIWVTGNPSDHEKDAIGFKEEWDPNLQPTPQTLGEKWKAFLIRWGSNMETAQKLAILDLRRLENAADLMQREKNIQAEKIDDLVQHRYVTPDFFQNQFFYTFSLDAGGVRASPLPKYKQLPHILIGPDHVVRIESASAAGPTSKIWE